MTRAQVLEFERTAAARIAARVRRARDRFLAERERIGVVLLFFGLFGIGTIWTIAATEAARPLAEPPILPTETLRAAAIVAVSFLFGGTWALWAAAVETRNVKRANGRVRFKKTI